MVGDSRDRVMVAYVHEGQLLEVLNWSRQPEGRYLIVDGAIEPLPADAKVVHAWYAPERRAFGFLIQSASFPLCPPTCHAKVIDQPMRFLLAKVDPAENVQTKVLERTVSYPIPR